VVNGWKGPHNRRQLADRRVRRTGAVVLALWFGSVGALLSLAYRCHLGMAQTLTPLAGGGSPYLSRAVYRENQTSARVSTPARVAMADRLAEEMANSWQREAAGQLIVTPAPATVQWRRAADDLTAPRPEVARRPAPGTGPPPLPDLGAPGQAMGGPGW